jgi:hypothetical protein
VIYAEHGGFGVGFSMGLWFGLFDPFSFFLLIGLGVKERKEHNRIIILIDRGF